MADALFGWARHASSIRLATRFELPVCVDSGLFCLYLGLSCFSVSDKLYLREVANLPAVEKPGAAHLTGR